VKGGDYKHDNTQKKQTDNYEALKAAAGSLGSRWVLFKARRHQANNLDPSKNDNPKKGKCR